MATNQHIDTYHARALGVWRQHLWRCVSHINRYFMSARRMLTHWTEIAGKIYRKYYEIRTILSLVSSKSSSSISRRLVSLESLFHTLGFRYCKNLNFCWIKTAKVPFVVTCHIYKNFTKLSKIVILFNFTVHYRIWNSPFQINTNKPIGVLISEIGFKILRSKQSYFAQ